MKLIIKNSKSYDDQIETLKNRGLIITDEENAKQILSRLSYYALTGYLHRFKTIDDKYQEGITFEKIIAIYEFDKSLRNILQYIIEVIEHTLKTQIGNTLAFAYGSTGYKNIDNFKDKITYEKILDQNKSVIQHNKSIPFVRHHIEKYNGEFPIWVIIELYTLGTISLLYDSMENADKRRISTFFNISPSVLSNWIKNVKYTRNLVAHYMRLYDFTMQYTPQRSKPDYENRGTSHKVFDQVYMMKSLFLNEVSWNDSVIPRFRELFQVYSEFIELDAIGFPENWEELLYKKHTDPNQIPQEKVLCLAK